jgi:hypothetical protein
MAVVLCWAGVALNAALAAPPDTVRVKHKGAWFVAESTNFSVWTKDSSANAARLAAECESLRERLQGVWKSEHLPSAWSPACAVVVHPSQAEYRRMFPAEGESSVGCTTITSDQGRVVFRRVDLRSDAADWKQNALPHELTHVVVADAFVGVALPGWLNEGLAMLAEESSLQARRRDLLLAACQQGRLPALQSLLQADREGRPLDANLRYSACHSLATYLVQAGSPQQLVDFARLSIRENYDVALRDVYQIDDGMPGLEQRWHRQIAQELAGRDAGVVPSVAAAAPPAGLPPVAALE